MNTAERVLNLAGRQYAAAIMERRYLRGSSWCDGYNEGVAGATGGMLKVYLEYLPRRGRLAVGAAIREEVARQRKRFEKPMEVAA